MQSNYITHQTFTMSKNPKNIITEEKQEKNGVWVIRVDKSSFSKIGGNTAAEKLDNALDMYLRDKESSSQQGANKVSATK